MFSNKKLLGLTSGLLLVGLACLAQAQVTMTGAGKGTPAVAVYAGPGDISGISWKWWVGLRCFNTAYTGNVADVYAPSDLSHTLLTCSVGGTINETIQALSTTCASSCTVKTLYDQSGALACAGAACTLSQATIANRPTYVASTFGSKPGMVFNGTSSDLSSSSPFTQAQPFVATLVSNQTATSTNDILSHSTIDIEVTGNSGFLIYAGSSFFRAAAINTTWSFIGTFNGASSQIDTANTASGAGTTSGAAGAANLSADDINLGTFNGTSFPWPGKIAEAGEARGSGIGGIFTAGQITSLQNQQMSYWGF